MVKEKLIFLREREVLMETIYIIGKKQSVRNVKTNEK